MPTTVRDVHRENIETLVKTIELEDIETFDRHRSSKVSRPTASTLPDTKTTDDMEKLRREIENIFSANQIADETTVLCMKPLFLDDMGRRFFTYLIDAELGFEYDPYYFPPNYVSSSTLVEISESNFELLVFLFTTCMEHLELSNGADYIGYAIW